LYNTSRPECKVDAFLIVVPGVAVGRPDPFAVFPADVVAVLCHWDLAAGHALPPARFNEILHTGYDVGNLALNHTEEKSVLSYGADPRFTNIKSGGTLCLQDNGAVSNACVWSIKHEEVGIAGLFI
jgi:hypothetical protein